MAAARSTMMRFLDDAHHLAIFLTDPSADDVNSFQIIHLRLKGLVLLSLVLSRVRVAGRAGDVSAPEQLTRYSTEGVRII